MLKEIRILLRLGLPVVFTQLAVMMMGVVDTMMLGHVSREALAGAALGNAWLSCTRLIGMGMILGIDPILCQAQGARDSRLIGLGLQRGLFLSIVVSAIIAVLWFFTGDALLWMKQDAALARAADEYVRVQIPSLPAFYFFVALRCYLQCRSIVFPAMWILFLSNGVNALMNWAFIFGHLGLPELGLFGAGIATTLTQYFSVITLIVTILALRLHRDAWSGWSLQALSPRGLFQVIRLGVPISIQFGFEVWAFAVVTIWAGRLGTMELAGHNIVLNLASLSFMAPLGLSIGAVTRVGNLIGQKDFRGASRAAWISFALGAAIMLGFAVFFIATRNLLPRLYTTDMAVVGVAAMVLPVAAAFQLFDGLQVVGSGILRGMGKTLPAAIFSMIGFYAIALPTAWWLCFDEKMGLPGLWWGLCVGLGAVALFFVLWVALRGPMKMARDSVEPGVVKSS